MGFNATHVKEEQSQQSQGCNDSASSAVKEESSSSLPSFTLNFGNVQKGIGWKSKSVITSGGVELGM